MVPQLTPRRECKVVVQVVLPGEAGSLANRWQKRRVSRRIYAAQWIRRQRVELSRRSTGEEEEKEVRSTRSLCFACTCSRGPDLDLKSAQVCNIDTLSSARFLTEISFVCGISVFLALISRSTSRQLHHTLIGIDCYRLLRSSLHETNQ